MSNYEEASRLERGGFSKKERSAGDKFMPGIKGKTRRRDGSRKKDARSAKGKKLKNAKNSKNAKDMPRKSVGSRPTGPRRFSQANNHSSQGKTPQPPRKIRRVRVQHLRRPLPRTFTDAISDMFKSGWCVHHVGYLATALPLKAFLYVSKMGRSPLRQENHGACISKPWCTAFNIDWHYKTRHLTSTCTCRHVRVHKNQLIDIISSKMGVPLVTIRDGPQGRLVLHLQARSQFSKYVAISHVWADGLGNNYRNALPECQLRALRDYIREMTGEVEDSHVEQPFWMDTLCVPVYVQGRSSNESYTAKMRSLNRMDSIYAEAESVLVLDLELMATRSHSIENCLARVVTSAWMSRCWTYQEAILANKCFFKFYDELHSVELIHSESRLFIMDGRYYGQRKPRRLVWTCESESARRASIRRFVQAARPRFSFASSKAYWDVAPTGSSPTSSDAVEMCVAVAGNSQGSNRLFEAWELHPQSAIQQAFEHFLLYKFFAVRHSWNNQAHRFQDAWNTLAGRSTSNEDDKIIILATLIGFHRQPLLMLRKDRRLRAVILNMRRIPLSLFFDSSPKFDGERHHTQRWIPITLGHDTVGSPVLRRENDRLIYESDFTGSSLAELRPKNRNQPLICIVNSVIPPSTKKLCLNVLNGSNMRLSLFSVPNDQIKLTDFKFTCFLLENWFSSEAVRAAVLYGTEKTDEQMTLFYHCPAHVDEERWDIPRTADGRKDATYIAEPIYEKIELQVLGAKLKKRDELMEVHDPSTWTRWKKTVIQKRLMFVVIATSTVSLICFVFVFVIYHHGKLWPLAVALSIFGGPLIVAGSIGCYFLIRKWWIYRSYWVSFRRG
ncbi:hypothetical protein K461DRAFT_300877 [Myriangium duriaei CBS 260.36]|uniref:Heterokaryon incompatibility domain-containing protein n=1 Tax=Myriangium duriaei CBS 260.36 TaxID=1168546 RepID=A0A9P4IVN1_9PEZI|nr:hypothetical protein K461DRAFT_300877 [Myriangium duriaei CBS 260.36]